MIQGVSVRPLARIPDERGMIMKMLSSADEAFEEFGEIYFSAVYPGVVKGWHLHKEMTLNYAVPVGMIKLVLYDDRDGSPTKGEIQEVFTGEQSYQLVTVPPGVINGFKGIGRKTAIVANLATIPHRPDEIVRIDPYENDIPYDWARKDG
jgi:dTDP-4-dehydrorhamnose 3,5-epimerase